MALKFPSFMDAQSTTPADPRVVEAMIPYFTEKFGHAASRNHSFGWEAEAGVDRAREQLAKIIAARDPKELVFTSGGTESINLAIKGIAEMYREKGNHIVTTAIEQRASLDVCKRLERQGYEVTYVPVRPDGLVELEAIQKAITDKTILISVMFANNEVGTIQDIAAIGRLAKDKGIIFHTDATQAVGKIPVNVETMGIDLLSCTAHLLYGPKGVGALYVRRKGPRVRIAPLIDPGAALRNRRAGRERRAGPFVDPVQPPPIHHRGRGRARRRADGRGRQAPARHVAAVRAGERRRGSEVHSLEGRVRGVAPWRIARRSSTITTTRGTSGPSPRTRRGWGRGSSERRNAAT